MSGLVPLKFGVDTLEVTFRGCLPIPLHADFDEGKRLAQENDSPTPITLAGREFFIQSRGMGRFAYQLSNELLLLSVSPSAQMPVVRVRLLAYGLALMGHEALYKVAERVADACGADGAGTVSRIDVCRDFQGFEPEFADMERVRCRMRDRSYYESGEGRTFRYGKNELVVRVYNKTAQALAEGLGWVIEGHLRCEGYEPGKPVWRAEVQLRRPALKAMGIDAPHRAFELLPEFLMTGLTEVELRVPQSDSTITRWPVDPRWEVIRTAERTAEPLRRVKATPRMQGRYEAATRALWAAETFGANTGSVDFEQVAVELVETMRELIAEGHDFEGRTEDKRRRLGRSRDEGVPF